MQKKIKNKCKSDCATVVVALRNRDVPIELSGDFHSDAVDAGVRGPDGKMDSRMQDQGDLR